MRKLFIILGMLTVVGLSVVAWYSTPLRVFLLSGKLGIEPSFRAMETYIEEQTAVGRTKAEVFAALTKIDQAVSIRQYFTPPGSIDSNAECYHVNFFPILKTLTLNRDFCFNREGRVIWSVFVYS